MWQSSFWWLPSRGCHFLTQFPRCHVIPVHCEEKLTKHGDHPPHWQMPFPVPKCPVTVLTELFLIRILNKLFMFSKAWLATQSYLPATPAKRGGGWTRWAEWGEEMGKVGKLSPEGGRSSRACWILTLGLIRLHESAWICIRYNWCRSELTHYECWGLPKYPLTRTRPVAAENTCSVM